MPSQVLGKVSVTPKGDYNAGTTYYALDIVGYEGGSYLAMKEVTGVEPSNDQVNWMQLSGPGLPGKNGTNGVTFTPSVSEAGVISWTNDGEEENPDPVDIMGPPGTAAGFGTVTATADNTSSETPSVDVQSSGPDTARNFTFAFSGLKGKSGDTPDIEIGTVTTLEPDQDATADITGTTPNLSLSLGIPKGQPGTSVSRIQRTSGTGAAGTTDTYTMYDSNDDAIGTFTVYNGTNGAGAGDFLSDGSVPMTGPLDMNGNRVTEVGMPTADTDAANKAYVDEALEGVTITTDAIPTEDSTNPVQSGGVFNALSNKQDTLSGTEDQLVGFNSAGEATAVPKPTAADVGAMPAVSGGTTGQVLTKTETGQEWGDKPVMYVHITLNGGTYNADKTFSEICQAYQDGCALFAVADWDSDIPVMSLDNVVPSELVAFSSYYYGRYFLFSVYPNSVWYGTDLVGANRVSFTPGTTGLTSDNVQDAIEEVNDKVVESTSTTVTLTASGWTGSAAPFSQQVSCSIVAADTAVVAVDVDTPGTDADADVEAINAWALCTQQNPTQGAGTLTFYCTEKPTINIPVKVGVA